MTRLQLHIQAGLHCIDVRHFGYSTPKESNTKSIGCKEKLLLSLRVDYIIVYSMAMNGLGVTLTLQKNVKYRDL